MSSCLPAARPQSLPTQPPSSSPMHCQAKTRGIPVLEMRARARQTSREGAADRECCSCLPSHSAVAQYHASDLLHLTALPCTHPSRAKHSVSTSCFALLAGREHLRLFKATHTRCQNRFARTVSSSSPRLETTQFLLIDLVGKDYDSGVKLLQCFLRQLRGFFLTADI